MNVQDRDFLKEFFRRLVERPLEPTDPLYVPIYECRDLFSFDPVESMQRAIEFTPVESVQLLSGFRGTGKSTELRRLKRRLEDSTAGQYVVVLFDLENYFNMSQPVDVSDFLLAFAGALGDVLEREKLVERSPARRGYWSRFREFLTRTRVELGEVDAKIIKVNLKEDPGFKRRLQEAMAGHLGTLVADVRAFVEECVKAVKGACSEDHELVVLVDSIEHIRGTSVNAREVQASLEVLFASHADKLRMPYLHVVYTVPPFVKVLYPGIGKLYSPGGVQILPAIKVRDEKSGEPVPQGLELLRRVVGQRGEWQRLLGTEDELNRLALRSGGHLRDLLHLLAEVIRRAHSLPVEPSVVTSAIFQVQREFLPLAEADAQWLARIMASHRAELADAERLPDFARFLDTHLVLCYQNGHEWYDVHPLIEEEVRRMTAAS